MITNSTAYVTRAVRVFCDILGVLEIGCMIPLCLDCDLVDDKCILLIITCLRSHLIFVNGYNHNSLLILNVM
jgi:hypothetical protein